MQPTTVMLALPVGSSGSLITREGLSVQVRVLDTRHVWDRTDYLVQPVAGHGRAWVSADRVQLKSA